jgi:hypothetical protein
MKFLGKMDFRAPRQARLVRVHAPASSNRTDPIRIAAFRLNYFHRSFRTLIATASTRFATATRPSHDRQSEVFALCSLQLRDQLSSALTHRAPDLRFNVCASASDVYRDRRVHCDPSRVQSTVKT